MKMSLIDEIIQFWFGKPEDEEYGKQRKEWFTKDPAFDEVVRSRFSSAYSAAVKGELEDWKASPKSCLALILLLDQIPRNIFRGKPQAFATDAKALETAKYAIAQGYDTQLIPVQRWFIYLPFEHSEDIADQREAISLFSTLKDDSESAATVEYAQRHYNIIERFGRFPHRNKILGRESTPEEKEFLSQPGSSF